MKRNLILLIASFAFCALIIEILLRIGGIEYSTFVVSDPVLGWSLRKSGHGWYRAEGNAHVRINPHGFRGPETTVEKPAGTYRIAMLGDSFTVGLDVAEEELTSTIIQENMQNCARIGGKKVEVLNFGVGGYGTAQELMLFRTRAVKFKPDLVVLQFFVSNDVFDNYRTLRESLRDEAPYYVVDATGKLVLDDSFLKNRDRRWVLDAGGTAIYYSRFLQLCNQARKVISVAITAMKDRNRKLAVLNETNEVLYPKDETAKAFQVTGGILEMLRDECKRNGIELVVAVIPAPFAVVPGAKRVADEVSDFDQRVKSINDSLGIPTFLYGPPMLKHVTEHNEPLYGFPGRPKNLGHWNPKGHRIAGKLLSAYLCDRLEKKDAPAQPSQP